MEGHHAEHDPEIESHESEISYLIFGSFLEVGFGLGFLADFGGASIGLLGFIPQLSQFGKKAGHLACRDPRGKAWFPHPIVLQETSLLGEFR